VPTDHRREILRLAFPAFLALVAEPMFLLADSAIVGYLGTAPLAGLGVASAVLLTAVNVFVFLAYGTTSVVARRLGAGDQRGALGAGIDGLWLALLLGVLTSAVVALLAGPMVAWFGAGEAVSAQAETYLRISAYGIPPMLVVLAATGVLRGLQDTRTPLVAAVAGFTANAALSFVLVHPAGMGIAGAAWGTVIAQTGMALGLVWVVVGGGGPPAGAHPVAAGGAAAHHLVCRGAG
jgi:putative MATE family efflux protein